MNSRAPLMAAFLALFTPCAWAEVHQCNGMWTDRPCDEIAAAPTTGAPTVSSDRELKRERSDKRSLMHELSTDNFNAKRQFGVGLDLTTLENRCLRDDISYRACEQSVQEARRLLDQRVRDAKVLRVQQEANDIEAEKLRRQDEDRDTDVIVIQNNNGFFPTPTPRDVYIGDPGFEPPVRPVPQRPRLTMAPLAPQPRR